MCSTRLPRETVSSWLWLLLCPVVASCTMRKRPCRHKLLHNWALCQQTMSNIVNPVARGAGHCRRGSGLQTTKKCCVPGKGGPPAPYDSQRCELHTLYCSKVKKALTLYHQRESEPFSRYGVLSMHTKWGPVPPFEWLGAPESMHVRRT